MICARFESWPEHGGFSGSEYSLSEDADETALNQTNPSVLERSFSGQYKDHKQDGEDRYMKKKHYQHVSARRPKNAKAQEHVQRREARREDRRGPRGDGKYKSGHGGYE